MDLGSAFTQYSIDIGEYLESKLPDIPVDIAMEIGDYIAHKTAILVVDTIKARDEVWKKNLYKSKTGTRTPRNKEDSHD